MDAFLSRYHPIKDIATKQQLESARMYEAKSKKKENSVQDSTKHSIRVQLATVIQKLLIEKEDCGNLHILYLDGDDFTFSNVLKTMVSSFTAYMPNWRAEHQRSTPAYEKLLFEADEENQHFRLFGAEFGDFTITLARIPEEYRTAMNVVWMDTCHPADKEDIYTIENMFKYRILDPSGISILAMTFYAKREFQPDNPIKLDVKNNIERPESWLLRTREFCNEHGYTIVDEDSHHYGSMIFLMYVIAGPDYELSGERTQAVHDVMYGARGIAPIARVEPRPQLDPFPQFMFAAPPPPPLKRNRVGKRSRAPNYDYLFATTPNRKRHLAGKMCDAALAFFKTDSPCIRATGKEDACGHCLKRK